MINEDYRDTLVEADETFGERLQYDLIREEAAEVIKAVSRFERGRVGEERVLEEVADLRILCDQIAVTQGEERDYVTLKHEKIERLKRRIEREDIND